MARTRQDAQTDTASEILDVAERLVQVRGFNGFSYADIAEALEVTKASLHYHFPTKGDLGKRDVITAAMRKTTVDSPRGKFTLSAAANPVQDIYLREAKGLNNEFKSVAVKSLADPARGCKM